MDRRELILAGLTAACLPSVGAAQAIGKVQRVGWPDYSSAAENLGIFVQALAMRGWVEGQTFAMEYRGGEGNATRLSTAAATLARLPVNIIVAPGTAEALAARKATETIPIVMTGVDDPVERGLVMSLARPGTNVTGLAGAGRELNDKLLSLVREIVPRAPSVGVLWDSNDADQRVVLGQIEAAARTLGMKLNPVAAQRASDVEPAVAAIRKQGSQALVALPSSMLVPRWIADIALKNGLLLASTAPGYVYEGGLIAYTNDWIAVFDRVAALVDRILKGAKPADLPVELPVKFKLVVNAKTAQLLGLTIPQAILISANSIIKT